MAVAALERVAAVGTEPNRHWWKLAAILLAAVLFIPALIYAFKGVGAFFAILGLTAAFYAARNSSTEAQLAPLRTSIRLSLEDIRAVLDEWDEFQFSPDADALADRTFNCRELLNRDSSVDSIAQFHHMVPVAERLADNLEKRHLNAHSARTLTKLLNEADTVAEELRDLWTRARADARGVADN